MNKHTILLALLIVTLTVSLFAGHYGYTVHGVPQGATTLDNPGILGAMVWAFDAIGFLFNMITFQIDGMPVILNFVFLFIQLVTVLEVVLVVRGD